MELTAAEIELIQLKRIEDDSKEKQDLLKEQLQYDKDLRYQIEQYDKSIKKYETSNSYQKQAYDELVLLNVPLTLFELKSRKVVVEFSSYSIDKIKPEDWKSEQIDYLYVNTKWGDLSFDENLKSELPNSLSNRYQQYAIKTIAKKIIDVNKSEKEELIAKNNRTLYIESLLEQLKDESPEGTTLVISKEYKRDNYNRNKPGYYVDIMTIIYPNKSWVRLRIYEDSWSIADKFDSKYIKPETNEEWLKYLMS